MSGGCRPVRGMTGPAGQRGAMAVEFALVVLPFLIIVLGLVQVGLTFGVAAALNEAATETARAIAVAEVPDSPPEDLLSAARARFKGPDPGRVTALLEDGASGRILRLEYDMPLLVPIPGWDVSRLRAAAQVDP